MDDLESIFIQAGQDFALRAALVDTATGRTWTCRQAMGAASRLAAGFAAQGAGPGDRILIRSHTCLPAVLSCWAAWRLGAVPVPVDPTWPPYLVDPVLAQVAPRLILQQDGAAPAGPALILADAEGRPSPWIGHWLDRAGTAPERPAAADEDPGAILFTSGSTGLPKGVVLSRGALARSARLVVDTFGWDKADRFLNLGELHAMSGLRNTCLAAAAAGAAAVLVPPARRDHPFRVLESIREHRATILGAGPALVRMSLRLRERIQPGAWDPLRQVLCTGGVLAAEDAAAFQAWTGLPVINYYGLTETAGICLAHTPESARVWDGTLGRPVGAACRILDDQGRECPPGQEGELVISGPNLMLGYLGRPDLTAEVLREGAFRTGDRAVMLDGGQVQLVGRLRHAIKTAHTDLLFPEEVEGALAGHAGLLDAAAVGVARPGEGERMMAFLVARDPAADAPSLLAEVHEYLRERLGPLRLPSGYRLLERIPRLAGGKIDRMALQREAAHGDA